MAPNGRGGGGGVLPRAGGPGGGKEGGGEGRGGGRGGRWGKQGGHGAGGGALVPPTERRARGGQAPASRLSARCPFYPKTSASLGRGWVESGHKADKCPFAPVR